MHFARGGGGGETYSKGVNWDKCEMVEVGVRAGPAAKPPPCYLSNIPRGEGGGT